MAEESKKVVNETIHQDLFGSRIVRELTPSGWTVRIFSPWPNPNSPEGEECESHAAAVELAKQRKKDREAAGVPAEKVEEEEPTVIVANSIGEGLEETIDRALSEVE